MFKIALIFLILVNNCFADENWAARHAREKQIYAEKQLQRENQAFIRQENNRILYQQKQLADKQRKQVACIAAGRKYCNY